MPAAVGGRDIRLETLARGINPQEMLLDLAQGIDDDRAQSAAAVEASFAAPEEGARRGGADRPGRGAASDLREAEAGPRSAARPGSEWQTTPAERPAPTRARCRGSSCPPRRRPPPPPPPAPAAEAAPPPSPRPRASILLVDDEEDVRAILGRHFAAAGFRIVEAGDPEEAAKVGREARGREDGPFVLVTDLGMPASGGASFHGGFEVVKRLWKMNLRPPVLMMTESLNQSLRLRARQMGVQSFVFKPTLSKLNARQFEADLSAFAAKLVGDVLPRLAEAAAGAPRPRARRRRPPRRGRRRRPGPSPRTRRGPSSS